MFEQSFEVTEKKCEQRTIWTQHQQHTSKKLRDVHPMQCEGLSTTSQHIFQPLEIPLHHLLIDP